jgi:hypothetical protein
MSKIVISLALTVFIGPGVGHLYLRRFLQGIVLIALTMLAFIHFLSQYIKATPNLAALLGDQQGLVMSLQGFIASHRSMVFYYDVIFAAIWAYAIVDAYFKAYDIFRAENPKNERNDDNEEDGNFL